MVFDVTKEVMMEVYNDVSKMQDIVFLFDVTRGNPNGDPDKGNEPRVDDNTGHGLVTDTCIKHKVRRYVEEAYELSAGMGIYMRGGDALNTTHKSIQESSNCGVVKNPKQKDLQEYRKQACSRFWDIRIYGAVMSTGVNCGQVTGPFQWEYAESVAPIEVLDFPGTRCAVTKEEDVEAGKVTEMGMHKYGVPYALYVMRGHFVPSKARKTGVTSKDLEVHWDALQNMWNIDRSAARGTMSTRGLYVISHPNSLGKGNIPDLLARIEIKVKDGVELPRKFSDYEVNVNEDGLVESGHTLSRLVG